MAQPATTYISAEVYLAREREAAHRSELVGDEIFATGGARRPHHLITTNLVREISTRSQGRPCEIYDEVRCDADEGLAEG